MQIVKNIPQKYLNIFYVIFSLFLYNGIIYFLNYVDIFSYNRDYIFAQYAFSYHKIGFVSRGLVPSILDIFNINNRFSLLIIFNILIVIYVRLILYIINLYQIPNKNWFLILFLFLFFGIPHFALDTFRLDLLIQVLALFVFILLYQKKNIFAFIICIICLFIHEASIFILVPILFLLIDDVKTKILCSALLSILFLGIIYYSNTLNEPEAISILQKHMDIIEVNRLFYERYINTIKENVFSIYSNYKPFIVFLYFFIYIWILYISFKNLFKIQNFKYLFLLPFLLCFIGIDLPRWYCFVFFLAMLYALHYNDFSNKLFLYILIITIILGIPMSMDNKFGIIPMTFHFLK